MECTNCLRTMAHSVLVRSVVDVDLCTGCAADLATRQSAATPLVVAALAQYLQEWGAAPSAAHRRDAGRRFWASVTPFADADDLAGVACALESLAAASTAVHSPTIVLDDPADHLSLRLTAAASAG
jgi:hypothetical protein